LTQRKGADKRGTIPTAAASTNSKPAGERSEPAGSSESSDLKIIAHLSTFGLDFS
jgi:hypothetical protein